MAKGRFVLAILVAGLVALTLTASGCGGSGDESSTSAVKRPSEDPPDFHLTEYDVNTTWDHDVSDKRVGKYLVSVWHDPAVPTTRLFIDSRPSEGTSPPLASAELARIQASSLRKYRERGIKKVKVGGHPAIRWAFEAGGEGYIEYFFAECGTSILLHGSTDPVDFEGFARFYSQVASRVKVVCDE
jgi:hypothetical protein